VSEILLEGEREGDWGKVYVLSVGNKGNVRVVATNADYLAAIGLDGGHCLRVRSMGGCRKVLFIAVGH
jgi:hypothetical protein